jgi:hypothetical protein
MGENGEKGEFVPASDDLPRQGALRKLRLWNLAVGCVLLLEGVLMLLLSSDFKLPVTTNYLSGTTTMGMRHTVLRTVTELRVGPMVALFLLLSGLALLLLTLPRVNGWYSRNLERGANYGRWMEYSVTASLMIVVIAMLSGIYDLSTLVLLFFLNAMMILFGWMMELHNQSTERTDWTAFIFGCIAGAIPWVVIFLYFVSAAADPTNKVPGFVYGIMVSIFLFFNCFAVNMVLQYKKVGPWRDYLFGEKVYIILSLTAKSALAWQIFGGTLRP